MSNNQPPPPGPDNGGDWSSQPNPYGPPPQQAGQWGPPPQHPPSPYGAPQQSPYGQPQNPYAGQQWQQPGPQQWSAPGTNPMSTQGPPSGPQTWTPTPKRRRTGAIVAAVVALIVLLGGGVAIALAVQDEDSSQATDPTTNEPSEPIGGDGTPSPTAPTTEPTDPTTTEPTEPTSTEPVAPAPNGPGTGGVDTTGRRVTAAGHQNNWEFKWEDNVYDARHIVSRDLETCTDVNPDATLAEEGCDYAMTATYMNEKDKVKITHVVFVFDNEKSAKKAKADEIITDKVLDLSDDALWDDYEKGSWQTKQQAEVVVFTVASGPKEAKQKKLLEYLRWSNTDFALSFYDYGF